MRALAAVLLAGALAAAGCGSSSSSGTGSSAGSRAPAPAKVALGPSFDGIGALPGALHGGPPWNPAPELRARLKAIGLPALGQEALNQHIHQHLDLFVDGRHVTVPALVGIDQVAGFLTILHTHDPSGIIHVESPNFAAFSLGQFFAVWGLPLSQRCIGSLCAGAGKELRAWVDGAPVNADPTRIVLAPHQEIVLAYGTPAQMPTKVPASYPFPQGL